MSSIWTSKSDMIPTPGLSCSPKDKSCRLIMRSSWIIAKPSPLKKCSGLQETVRPATSRRTHLKFPTKEQPVLLRQVFHRRILLFRQPRRPTASRSFFLYKVWPLKKIRDGVTMPSLSMLNRFSEALGVPVSEQCVFMNLTVLLSKHYTKRCWKEVSVPIPIPALRSTHFFLDIDTKFFYQWFNHW